MAKRKTKTWKRWMARIVCLILIVVACVVGWDALRPLVIAESVPVYVQYTVETGDIETSMSLSGSISLRESETFSASDRTTVQEVYVEADQRVNDGDDLLRLANGETFQSSIDGTVTELNVSAGDAVWPQMTLVTVGDLDNLRVSTSVDEYDIDKVSVGQACSVTVISLGLTFETEIDHVNRVSSSAGSIASYTVTADIDAPENVLPGMQATVTIPRESVSGVNILAMAALSFDEDGEPYVLMENAEGGYDEVEVTTGLNDGMYVEITDGLEAGDVVYVQTGTESVESVLSLTSLYKAVFGETTVINDRSGGDRGMSADGSFPGEMGNMELPEGMELPDGMMMPEGMAPTATEGSLVTEGEEVLPDANAAESTETTSSAQPTASVQPAENVEPPDGMAMPDGLEPPDGTQPSGGDTTGQQVEQDDTGAAMPDSNYAEGDNNNAQ